MTHEPGAEPAGPEVEAAAAATDGWRRMHPLTPLLKGGLMLIVIAGVLVANLRDRFIEIFVGEDVVGGNGDVFDLIAEQGLALAVIGGVLGMILIIVLFSWLSWRVHTYRITGEAVENREGLVLKKHRRAPLERIQSVNLQRPMLARLVGLTKIEVQTAGQGGKVELAYLGHRDAKTVREQILRSAAYSQQALDEQVVEAVDEATAYDGTAYASATGRVTERVHDLIDFDIDAQAAEQGALVRVPVKRLALSILLGWEMLVLLACVAATIVVASSWSRGILGALIPLALVFASIMITQFNKGFNFTLSHYGEGVRTGSGLTSTNTESIPFGRIHAVEAQQPLGWRPFGWWKVRITTAGHSVAQAGQNQNQNIVLPVGREKDVLKVLETLLPGVGHSETDLAELRNGLTGPGAGYLGAGPRAGILLWFGKRRAGVRIDAQTGEATLRIRRGALTRTFAVMPVVRAQSVQLRRPAVHRALGLASVQAHTVLGPVVMQMRGLELARARELFDELAATVLRVQREESDRKAASTTAQGGAA